MASGQVLSDYTSEKLDLSNREVFRDLEKPSKSFGSLLHTSDALQHRYWRDEDPLASVVAEDMKSAAVCYSVRKEDFSTVLILRAIVFREHSAVLTYMFMKTFMVVQEFGKC